MEKNIEVYRGIKNDVIWNPVTQRLVYESLIKNIDFYKKSILDLGCGKGDFLHYIQTRSNSNRHIKSYIGYDAMPEFVHSFNKRFTFTEPKGKNTFRCKDLFTAELPQSDIIMALASLEIKEFPYTHVDHTNKVLHLFVRMWEAANDCVVIATQSQYAEIKDNSCYFDPHTFVMGCVRYVGCRKFIVDHSYAPHFFTFIAYKGKTYWEDAGGDKHSAVVIK